MSQLLIQRYLNELQKLKQVSGTQRESVVREAFKDLLKGWARSHDLTFVPEYKLETKTKEGRYVDGALLHTLRVPFGYWEAKDSKDDLEYEIQKKFKAGYPNNNIIFEDSTQAVLYQHGAEVMRSDVDDVKKLEKLLTLFFEYERPEIEAFRKAVEQFKADLPAVVEALRAMIESAYAKQPEFREANKAFLTHAREAINPSLTEADVREMLIQHVLTGEVFEAVFPGTTYHEDNNVARELHKLEATFFTGNTKFQTLKGLEPYYAAIRRAAAQISTHHEKQTFLKAIYENFYKVYNPKAADRLGVVYTPNEIVRFMIESADWLCEKHFKRSLIDKDVEILDPAAGTGTFICELLEHFRGQPAKLRHKYVEELHANEVAILPYYVANLNVEATYAAITGEYTEYPNLCFVDTLDNTFALRKYKGHQHELFGGITDDNVKRIRRQNNRRISVIIGNPPYNANQLNENENNKNREYPEIDKRIKDTYIKASTAQKTKLYDMYARFFRWASDRLDENGVLAFITNRSFIESRTFDGFRAVVEKEFNEIWIVDLGGDVRANPKLSGTKHNVFGIQTGVAISFMVKRAKAKGCRIFYARRPEMEAAEEKLSFLSGGSLGSTEAEQIKPGPKNHWISQAESDFDAFIPLVAKDVKHADVRSQQRAIFKLYSLGIVTNRDDWAFDFDRASLSAKVAFFCERYESERMRWKKSGRPRETSTFVDRTIKWTTELESHMRRGTELSFAPDRIVEALYRPFVAKSTYFAAPFTHRPYKNFAFFPQPDSANVGICLSFGKRTEFGALATDRLPSLDVFLPSAAQTVCQWRYRDDGSREENITDWAFDQFRKHFQPGRGKKARPITKGAIFLYVYGVLHDPIYREKYALNLKREFPRIPFYPDFWQWADWGKALIELHIGYESVTPAKLKRTDLPDEKARAAGQAPKPRLKADKETGCIFLDSETTLAGIPRAAWEYKLGNRSALEWILDQYKEKKPRDPTIREKFDIYRFGDYKDRVVDLLARVTTVSVKTTEIVEAMRRAKR